VATIPENKRANSLKLKRNARQLRSSVAVDLRVMADSHVSGLSHDQRAAVLNIAKVLEKVADALEGYAMDLGGRDPDLGPGGYPRK
jgi:hypothetical protein